MRRAGILGALLATAALMCAMPGLMRMPASHSRTAPRLQTPRLRTLTVWLVPGDMGDQKLLSSLCSAFEKERKGVRVFLRTVTADEFEGETSVLPDAALFSTGDIPIPEKVFLPVANKNHSSGQFAGVQYAAPLWLAPNVLSLPQNWLQKAASPAPRQDSLLASSTAEPEANADSLPGKDDLPWGMLLQQNAVEKPQGVGWQQLLALCPEENRAQLVSAVLGTAFQQPEATPSSQEWVTTLPYSRTVSPTPAPALSMPARVETLASHLSRVQKGESVCAFVFPTAVSDRVRYAALCRDTEDARAFWQFLFSHQGDALSHALIPPQYEAGSPDVLVQSLIESYRTGVLPNAFVHTKQEICQLCSDGFARCEDPFRTLLGLR